MRDQPGCNSQLEIGFTMIPNDILDALGQLRLAGRQWQIVMLVIRKTYGFQRKTWDTSNREIRGRLGISRSHIAEDIKQLVERRILTTPEKGSGNRISIGIQEQYGLWRPFPRTGALPKKGMTAPEKRSASLPKKGAPIMLKKERKIKERESAPPPSEEPGEPGAPPSEQRNSGTEIAALKSRYSSQVLIDKVFEAIASTRQNGKVADSVLTAQLKKWTQYPVDHVVAAIQIYLDKGCARDGKDEKYLLGIMRYQGKSRPANGNQHQMALSCEPKGIDVDEIIAND